MTSEAVSPVSFFNWAHICTHIKLSFPSFEIVLYNRGKKEKEGSHTSFKYLHIRIPFVCAWSYGIQGTESVCTEHFGEQQFLEVRSCYAARRNVGNNCCENISQEE